MSDFLLIRNLRILHDYRRIIADQNAGKQYQDITHQIRRIHEYFDKYYGTQKAYWFKQMNIEGQVDVDETL